MIGSGESNVRGRDVRHFSSECDIQISSHTLCPWGAVGGSVYFRDPYVGVLTLPPQDLRMRPSLETVTADVIR